MYDTILSSSDGCQQDDNSLSGDAPHVAGGSLSDTIELHIQAIRSQRFRLALQAFEMHRMEIGIEYNEMTFEDLLRVDSIPNTNNSSNGGGSQGNVDEARLKKRIRDKVPSGIGKIGGLPLPHAGQSLYVYFRITTMRHYENLGESLEDGASIEENAEDSSTLEPSSPHPSSIPVATSSSTGSLLSLVGSSSNLL